MPRAVPAGNVDRQRAPSTKSAVVELTVRNHPGTMSHITGLFARRAFNLEAILCAPVGDGVTSRVLLLVGNEPRLEQLERQLTKLYDVLGARRRDDVAPEFFARVVNGA
jgi:acetolactate synthase-1/3 small subunit